MHSYSRSSMYTMTAIRKISVTGGESERRRLKRAYCTNDVPGERSVDEVSCFFFPFLFFALPIYLLSLLLSCTRSVFPFRSRFEDGLPLLAFIATMVASSARQEELCSRAFRTASPLSSKRFVPTHVLVISAICVKAKLSLCRVQQLVDSRFPRKYIKTQRTTEDSLYDTGERAGSLLNAA